jgi:HEAT repeat protein
MRRAALALGPILLFAACGSTPEEPATTLVQVGAVEDARELDIDESSRLVLDTERNVNQWEELRLQGMTQKMEAVRRSIAVAVDGNLDVFSEMALEGELNLQRNKAVKCLGFAFEQREAARKTLVILLGDGSATIAANAARALGILRDPETDLTPLITLLAHRDVHVRTNAATALIDLFRIKPTPRQLPAQYYTAIDRLITMLHDPASIRSRRAAAWALANMHHPEVLDHLVSALADADEQVQVGGLYGLRQLGDARSLEPLLAYLEGEPGGEAGSWAHQALVAIAMNGGFAKTASELRSLGDNARLWRDWFRQARNK